MGWRKKTEKNEKKKKTIAPERPGGKNEDGVKEKGGEVNAFHPLFLNVAIFFTTQVKLESAKKYYTQDFLLSIRLRLPATV